ncbi:hypothetical protein V1511DRAFT_492383 [Dipodascopsis uninucleata]
MQRYIKYLYSRIGLTTALISLPVTSAVTILSLRISLTSDHLLLRCSNCAPADCFVNWLMQDIFYPLMRSTFITAEPL